MRHQKEEKTFKKLFDSSWWIFLTGFSWELVEELLEGLIAELLTNLIAVFIVKALLTFSVVASTIMLKKLLKRLLRPIIIKLTYREGNDKVKALQNYWTKVRGNKVTGLISGIGFAGISYFQTLVPYATNCWWIALIAFVVFFNIGIFFGGETLNQIQERLAQATLTKEENALIKEAQNKLKQLKKQAKQTEAEKAKEEADKKAKQERDSKVEAIMQRLIQEEKEKEQSKKVEA